MIHLLFVASTLAQINTCNFGSPQLATSENFVCVNVQGERCSFLGYPSSIFTVTGVGPFCGDDSNDFECCNAACMTTSCGEGMICAAPEINDPEWTSRYTGTGVGCNGAFTNSCECYRLRRPFPDTPCVEGIRALTRSGFYAYNVAGTGEFVTIGKLPETIVLNFGQEQIGYSGLAHDTKTGDAIALWTNGFSLYQRFRSSDGLWLGRPLDIPGEVEDPDVYYDGAIYNDDMIWVTSRDTNTGVKRIIRFSPGSSTAERFVIDVDGDVRDLSLDENGNIILLTAAGSVYRVVSDVSGVTVTFGASLLALCNFQSVTAMTFAFGSFVIAGLDNDGFKVLCDVTLAGIPSQREVLRTSAFAQDDIVALDFVTCYVDTCEDNTLYQLTNEGALVVASPGNPTSFVGWLPDTGTFETALGTETGYSDFAFDFDSDIAVASYRGDAGTFILRIDPRTGSAIGPRVELALAFDAIDFGSGVLYGVPSRSGSVGLYTIDLVTGGISRIGSNFADQVLITGIVYVDANNMYAVGQGGFYHINPSTGVMTLRVASTRDFGSLTFAPPSMVASLTFEFNGLFVIIDNFDSTTGQAEIVDIGGGVLGAYRYKGNVDGGISGLDFSRCRLVTTTTTAAPTTTTTTAAPTTTTTTAAPTTTTAAPTTTTTTTTAAPTTTTTTTTSAPTTTTAAPTTTTTAAPAPITTTAASTMAPGSCPSFCPLADSEDSECKAQRVSFFGPVCQAGRCIVNSELADIDCSSSFCRSSEDGTPCEQCDCACAGQVGRKRGTCFTVRDCCGEQASGEEEDEEEEVDSHQGLCGNGVVDPGEDCDGYLMDGFYSKCDHHCRWVTSTPAVFSTIVFVAVVLMCCMSVCAFLLRRRRCAKRPPPPPPRGRFVKVPKAKRTSVKSLP